MSGERVFLMLIALLLAYGVGCLGRNRRIGFWWAFFISLFNSLLGLIVVLCSKKNSDVTFVDESKKEDE